MTTPRKTTARKSAPRKAAEQDATALTGAEAVRKTDEELIEEEKTATEAEVDAETDETSPKTFTITVRGEDIEIEDMVPEGDIPGSMMFLTPKSSQLDLAHYGGLTLKSILGEEQLTKLIEMGASANDLQAVVPAWRDARGLGK